MMQFPPISFFALLRAEANDYAHVQQFLSQAINAVQLLKNSALKNDVMIYDPIRPQMERLKGMERAQLLLQANSRAALQRLLKMWMPQISALPLAAKIRWSLDIDPLEF